CDDGNTVDCDGCRGDCSAVETGCGDGFVCGVEECDDATANSDVMPDACRTTCVAAGCGDTVIDTGEECDDPDLGGQTCALLGHDGGPLACNGICSYDETACIDCAPGLTFCDGGCVDTKADDLHCGGCNNPCGADICVGGLCESVAQPWSMVGTNPVSDVRNALAHDLGTNGKTPTVVWLAEMGGGNRAVTVSEYTSGPAWDTLNPSPSGIGWFNETVSITFDATTAWVAWSSGGAGAIHVAYRNGAGWTEVGAPGFPSACGSHWNIDLVLDASARPHLTSFGAGGCAVSIDYGWWDGLLWQSHPSATGFPAGITSEGRGNPAIVYTDQAYIAVPDTNIDGTSIHSVKYWDSNAGAWVDLGSLLDMNPASDWMEPTALVADATGNFYVAWAESDGGAPATYDIYVKYYSFGSGTWTLLGPAEVNGAGSATSPSLALIGGVPWVAYMETNGGVDEVVVRRYDVVNDTWIQVGPALNVNPAANGVAPVIIGIDGIPTVSFREETGPGTYALYVFTFP
ncbi:MAG: hypothetical protein ABI333_04080, partial [bacterium]